MIVYSQEKWLLTVQCLSWLVSPSCLQDLGLQPEDHFVLKVVQLEDITHVRHSVFVIGNAGTGVTSVDH